MASRAELKLDAKARRLLVSVVAKHGVEGAEQALMKLYAKYTFGGKYYRAQMALRARDVLVQQRYPRLVKDA